MDELRQMGVPPGALRVEIDDPRDRRLEQPVGDIRGWFAGRDLEASESFYFQIAGITVPHSMVKREDVEGALPGHTVAGFKVHYDLADYLPSIQNKQVSIRLVLPGYDPFSMRFTVEDRALVACVASASL